jgi:hypothetical protein
LNRKPVENGRYMKNDSWNSWSNPAARKMVFVAMGLAVATIVWAVVLDFSTPTAKNAPPVKNSPYDGSVSQVKYWLREYLKDPDSVQYIDWSTVKTLDDGQHAVLVKYRAKNSFGGYVIEQRLFVLDQKGVVAEVVAAATKRVVYKR